MQEANVRPGRASPQNLNHKKAAVELYVGPMLSLAASPALKPHYCNKSLCLQMMKS